MMDDIIETNKALDGILVNLGHMVLRLSSPMVTRTAREHQALARSVKQFSVCANCSASPRVRKLAEQLEGTIRPQGTIRPRLRLVASR
jgi:hypothetical protein